MIDRTYAVSDDATMVEDLAALLRALGIGDHARPQSPHEVMLEAIGAVESLTNQIKTWSEVSALHNAREARLFEEGAALRAELAEAQGEIEDLHLVAQGVKHYWRCEQPEGLPCQRCRAESAEARATGFTCKARGSMTSPPQDCDWPFCGCDPHAEQVVEALAEAGWGPLDEDLG